MQNSLPILETERLILKAPNKEHFTSWEANFADYEIIKNLTKSTPWPYPKGGVEDYFINSIEPTQNKNSWFWGIFLKDDKTENMIGSVEVRYNRSDKIENGNVGYWLGKKFWGNGYMTEAVLSAYNFVFNNFEIDNLIITNATQNPNSGNISRKAGARLISTVKTDKYIGEGFDMEQIWNLSKQDWLNRNNNDK